MKMRVDVWHLLPKNQGDLLTETKGRARRDPRDGLVIEPGGRGLGSVPGPVGLNTHGQLERQPHPVQGST